MSLSTTAPAHARKAYRLLNPRQGARCSPDMDRVMRRTATCRKQEAPCVY